MTVRVQDLQTVGFQTATFKLHQTAGSDDLTDADLGKAVTILGNYEVGPGADGDVLVGKLISLSLTDADVARAEATKGRLHSILSELCEYADIPLVRGRG